MEGLAGAEAHGDEEAEHLPAQPRHRRQRWHRCGGDDNSADASGFGVGGGGGGSNLVPPGGTSALRTDPAQLTIS